MLSKSKGIGDLVLDDFLMQVWVVSGDDEEEKTGEKIAGQSSSESKDKGGRTT